MPLRHFRPPKWMFGLNRKRFSALAIWVVENVLAAFGCGPLTGKVSVIFQLCVPLNCCVDNDPIVLPAPVDNRLNPNCEIAERSTSAKRTCSRISPVSGGDHEALTDSEHGA